MCSKQTGTSEKTGMIRTFCPFQCLCEYLFKRGGFRDYEEQFFIFSDGSPVTATNFRTTLKSMLRKGGFNASLYGTHAFRAGRACDMVEMGISVETIKQIGRWKSNAVFTYLHH